MLSAYFSVLGLQSSEQIDLVEEILSNYCWRYCVVLLFKLLLKLLTPWSMESYKIFLMFYFFNSLYSWKGLFMRFLVLLKLIVISLWWSRWWDVYTEGLLLWLLFGKFDNPYYAPTSLSSLKFGESWDPYPPRLIFWFLI